MACSMGYALAIFFAAASCIMIALCVNYGSRAADEHLSVLAFIASMLLLGSAVFIASFTQSSAKGRTVRR